MVVRRRRADVYAHVEVHRRIGLRGADQDDLVTAGLGHACVIVVLGFTLTEVHASSMSPTARRNAAVVAASGSACTVPRAVKTRLAFLLAGLALRPTSRRGGTR
jgi:hypothetical protein